MLYFNRLCFTLQKLHKMCRKMTKLMDLNLDCLESIVKHLDFADLLNVASINEYLNTAVNWVYTKKYPQKELIIRGPCFFRRSSFLIAEDFIVVDSLDMILQLLRCFGYLFNRIQFRLNFNFIKYNKRVLNNIHEYCSESLSQFELLYIPNNRLKQLNRKPFNTVKFVHLNLVGCYLGVGTDWFNKFFPKMEQLEIEFVQKSKRKFKTFDDNNWPNFKLK